MNTLLQFMNQSMLSWFDDNILDPIIDFVGQIIWTLCDIFFVIIDLFETIFKKFAGIDVVEVDGGETVTGDLVLYAIKSDIVQQIFTSILILSLFLLIIFTILAIVKNQYSDKQEPVSKIINSSVKALLMYLLVPVGVIVGLLAGNVVLQAIDGATRLTGGSTASGAIFSAAAYNANKLREEDIGECRSNLKEMISKGYFAYASNEFVVEMQTYGVDVNDPRSAEGVSPSNMDQIAQLIDESFANGSLGENVNRWGFWNVRKYYNVLGINIVITWVGGGFLIFNLGKICWGLIARLFKMTLYYAISPAVMATFPLDGGKALGSWRSEMIKNATMAYCAVGVLNVLYSILPFVSKMDFFGGIGLGNLIVQVLIYIIAFSSAKDLINTISGWFGTGNALAEGEAAQGTWKAAKQKTKDTAMKGMRRVAGWKAGAAAAEKYGGNKLIGAFRGAIMAGGGDKSWAEQFNEMEEAIEKREKAHYSGEGKHGFTKKGEAKYEAQRQAFKEREELKEKQKTYEEYSFSGDYSAAADTGYDQAMQHQGEVLRNISDAGKALTEVEDRQLQIEKAKNEQMVEFVTMINDMAKAKKAKITAELELKAEVDTLYGKGTWDKLDEGDRAEFVTDAIRDGASMGLNTDILKELNATYIEKEKALSQQTKAYTRRTNTDESFAKFTSTTEGKKLYKLATNDDEAKLAEVDDILQQYEKTGKEIQRDIVELGKKQAEINQRELKGDLNKDEKDTIKNYRKTHKSK